MTAAYKIARRIAGISAACALALTIFSGQEARAKDKSLKGELEHALVGQTVTSRILLGDRARPTDLVQHGITWNLPVHTLVEAETGEIRYRVEDRLLLERPDVSADEMGPSFEAGTSFRISAIHFKDDKLEIKLSKLGGRSTEVKLIMGKDWQSRYDAAAVRASMDRVFSFDQPRQEAGQAPPQTEAVETTPQGIPPTAPAGDVRPPDNQSPGSNGNWQRFSRRDGVQPPANQVSVPPNLAVHPEASGPENQLSIRAAYIDCGGLEHAELHPRPDASSSPVVVLGCGQQLVAVGEQGGWVEVRTEQNETGYVSPSVLKYGEPPSPDQSTAEQSATPPDAAATPSQSVESNQSVVEPRTEPPAESPYSSELPSRFALTAGYLIFAMISIMVALALRQSSGTDVRMGHGRLGDSANSAAPDNEETTHLPGSNGNVPASPYNEAACYLTGCGKKQDTRKAWNLFAASAQEGNKEAGEVLTAAGVARFPEANTASLDRGAPALTIVLGVVLTAIGGGIVAALLECLGIWKK